MCAGTKLESCSSAELISAIEVSLVGSLEIMEMPRVSFNDKVEYQEAQDIHSFDEEQAVSMWYSRAEMKALRKEARQVAESFRVGNKIKNQYDCIRGLEKYCDRRRQRAVISKVAMVLDLQEDNLDEGISGSAGLGALLQSLSSVDTRASLMQAKTDFLDAYDSPRAPLATHNITVTPAA